MIIFMCTAFRSDFARSTQTAVFIPGDLATQNWEFKVTVSNVKQLHTKLKTDTHRIL